MSLPNQRSQRKPLYSCVECNLAFALSEDLADLVTIEIRN